jgi:hypothetical protein
MMRVVGLKVKELVLKYVEKSGWMQAFKLAVNCIKNPGRMTNNEINVMKQDTQVLTLKYLLHYKNANSDPVFIGKVIRIIIDVLI